MPSLSSDLYEFGEFRVDPQARVLRRGEELVSLTHKAFDVLLLLIQHGGDVVSKDELMQAVWPDSFVEESNLTQTVFMLRRALGETPDRRYILTVQGRGYRFVPEVKTLPANGRGRDEVSPLAVGAVESGPAIPNLLPHARSIRTRALLAFGFLAVAMIGLILWLLPTFSRRANASFPIRSIAVLPLDNFSGDPSQQYFADGMTDQLITDLAKVGSLRVISRTSIMQYKSARKPLPEIARELNVDAIVEGSVTRSGQRVRVTAQLIQAPTDRHIWAETYDRDLSDILKLQGEVADAIAEQVRAQLTPTQQAQIRGAHALNPAAYDAYLKGHLIFTNDSGNPESLQKAQRYFEESLRLDPNFALAYAGLANTYVFSGFAGALQRDQAYRSAKQAVAKAVELDDSIGEAHDVLGLLSSQYDWDWEVADREFSRAIALAPSYSCGNEDRAIFLAQTGRRAEALEEIKKIDQLDYGSSAAQTETWAFYAMRDYPRLIEATRRGLLLNPKDSFQHYALGVGYERTGKLQEAISEYQKAIDISGDSRSTLALAHAYSAAGKRSEAETILRDLERKSRQTFTSPFMMATIYAGLGENDKAFAFLETAYAEKSFDIPEFLRSDLALDNLRSDPRYRSLLRRVGLEN